MEVKKYIDKFVTTVYDFYLYETDNYNTNQKGTITYEIVD